MRKNRQLRWAAKALALCLTGAAVMAGTKVTAPVSVHAEDSIIDSTQNSGSITVKKNGPTANSPLGGAEFSIYKVMSITPGAAAGQYASYSKEAAFADALANVTPDELGSYSSAQLEDLIDSLVTAAESAAAAGKATTDDTNGEAAFTNLDLGYYLVIETKTPQGYVAGSPFLIAVPSTDNYNNPTAAGTSWVYDVTAEPKNNPVSIKKELAAAETGAEQDGTVAAGDYVKYQVTTQIPDYPEEYFAENVTFTINDVMSDGLEIQNDTGHPVKVTVGGTDVTGGADTFALTASDQTGTTPDLTITFVKDYIRQHGGKAVVVTYYAKVTQDAVTGPAGNDNKVTLTYNNRPGETEQAGPVEVKVYSFNIKVEKFTEDGTKKALAGAEFELYDNAQLTGTALGTATTDDSGNLTFAKVDAGTYYLKETESPRGYTLLSKPVKVEIAGSTGDNVTLKVDDTAISATTGTFVTRLEKETGTAVIAVENYEGFTLPSTGGAGIALFLIIGAAGIITISVVVAKKTRKNG